MSELSAEEIIRGIKSRDNTVLQYVYQKYYPIVHHFITCNNGSSDDAQDVFQEAVIVIYRKIKNEKYFLLNSSFKTFLYSIARHLWLKQLRDLKYEDKKFTDQHKFIELKEEPFIISGEDQRMSIYQKHFRKLPPDCQNILKMSLQNVPQKEIAEALGFKSENYVKKRKHYCKEYLIQRIKEDPQFRELTEGEER